ncbi:envelope integrity protein Cei [Jongsikchunia kroppenstedtii]|uniref:envelope integrity protein Cei n=1 Tax=Jongsikchunia kroppenstedtii TaxID=1121721 RepID=UPI0003626ACD|nr:envelope integrity protein Cei [Jongsikchunia kroppenstedtii]
MVSSITAAAYPTDDHGRPFRRRRWIPWASAVAVLLLLTVIVWATALSTGGSKGTAAACPAPPAPSSTPPSPANPADGGGAAATTQPASFGSPISRAQMKTVAPAALSSFQIRVLNATSQRGAASKVLGDLTDEGFVPVPEPASADDPVYYNHSLECYGQIRFGAAGVAAAAAVWIAAPCNELIQDSRPGTQVDLVLGNQYKSNERSQDASALLATLKSAGPQDKNTGADPALLAAVHKTKC